MFVQKRRIVADTDPAMETEVAPVAEEGAEGEVSVDPEATDLLFEAEDVAELIAEVTEEPVEVTAEDDGTVTFAVGEDEFTVQPDGDEEVLEACRRVFRGKKPVSASTNRAAKPAGKTIRKVPNKK